MGTEASKLHAPDNDFGRSGEEFLPISPMSDISNPSDIHRIQRSRALDRNPVPVLVDPNRRVSRTVTKAIRKQSHKQAKQLEKDPATSRSRNVPHPSHFYFPTKETERAVEQAEPKVPTEENKENDKAKEMLRKTKKIAKKISKTTVRTTQKTLHKTEKILKKTHKVMSGCFAENQEEDPDLRPQNDEPRHHPTLGIARKVVPKTMMSNLSRQHVSSKQAIANGRSFVIRDTQSFSEPILSSSKPATVNLASAALHEAEDYFTRHTSGSAEVSPYVENKPVKKVHPLLGKGKSGSPVSNLFDGETEPSVLSNSLNLDAEKSVEKKSADFCSPSSSYLQYQNEIGTIAETPGYYPDDDDTDPLFDDATADSDEKLKSKHERQNGLPSIHEMDDNESALSYNRPEERNTDSAFRPRPYNKKEPIEQIAALRPNEEELSQGRRTKLESLFRPVLPALSADDAETKGIYDHWEIKVTESAPGILQGIDGSPDSQSLMNQRRASAGHSPSMLSIDSQVNASPALTKLMVSKQALYNAEFLFAEDDKRPLLLEHQTKSDRDNALFSINTIGSRSRVSSRHATKAAKIPVKYSESGLSADEQSQGSDRRVKFSLLDAVSGSVGLAPKESIDIPVIESKLSDLTDMIGRRASTDTTERRVSTGSTRSGILKTSSHWATPAVSVGKHRVSFDTAPSTEHGDLYEEKKEETPFIRGQWGYKDDHLTPYRPGEQLKDKTFSPYHRFQSAKGKFEATNDAPIDDSAIESKVSDLSEETDDFSPPPSEENPHSIPQTVLEEEPESESPETVSGNSQMQVHWAYSVKDGNLSAVTPSFSKHVAKSKHATKSPFLRFENAKQKFGNNVVNPNPTIKKSTSDNKLKASVGKAKAKVGAKEVPFKSPRSSRTKPVIKNVRPLKPGGSVANKIEELNQRVIDAKIDRKKHRWTKSNPRKYGVVDSNAVRTRALSSYKTSPVGLKKINMMSAAKFNSIPIEDDSSVDTSMDQSKYLEDVQADEDPLAITSRENVLHHDHVHDEEDELSKLTADSSAIETVRQPTQLTQYTGGRISEGTYSSASSGFSNVKKRVFGSSISKNDPRLSIGSQSHGGSTTMSSILGKENETYLPFRNARNTVKPNEQTLVAKPDQHLSPTERTPMQAQKWRTLAAAAHLRDSEKKTRKGLSVHNANHQHPASAYGY